jgi:YbbR domain-containing protein
VRRAVNFLLRNWPLKLGALLLATVLYAGLVLSSNVRVWTGVLPVDALRPPAGAVLLTDIAPVTRVSYRAPLDVGVVGPDSFRAYVDLSRVDVQPGGPPATVSVSVSAVDTRISVVDFEPRTVDVRLDPVETRQVAVSVSMGSVPEGISVGTPQVDPAVVTVRGASSRVSAISAVVARVTIDASAINVDQQFDLVPVDAQGNQVPGVEIEPARARVRIAVARELATRTLPVVPNLTGQLAEGYRLVSVTVDPITVTVSGEAAAVGLLELAPTVPIDLGGRSTDLDTTVGLGLPAGVSVSGSDQVHVVVTVAQATASQTFGVGLTLDNAAASLAYSVQPGQLLVTLAGPQPALDALAANPAALLANLDVAGLRPGTHTLTPTINPPDGLELVGVSPGQVTVVVAQSP